MNERRHHWKEGLGKQARQRAAQREQLLVEKDLISREISSMNMEQIRSDRYSQLKQQQAEITARLATL